MDRPAEILYDFPVPRRRRITPSKYVGEIYGDEFRHGRNYTNWRPDGRPDWLLIYTAEGSGRLCSPGKTQDTRPGEAVVYGPGEYQDYSTGPDPGRWHLLWVHFAEHASWNPLLRWLPGSAGVRSVVLPEGEVREGFRTALERAIRFSQRKFSGARDIALNALEEVLLWGRIGAARTPGLIVDARVRRAMEYLDLHADQPFHLETLARHSGISVSRLALLFKKETGCTPQQFWERNRLRRAAQLLRLTSLTIGEIAGEVGFTDAFYFSKRFRRFFGNSPRAFRQKGESADQ